MFDFLAVEMSFVVFKISETASSVRRTSARILLSFLCFHYTFKNQESETMEDNNRVKQTNTKKKKCARAATAQFPIWF